MRSKRLEGRRRLGGGKQQAIDLAGQQAVHFAGFDRAIFFGVADHDVVAERADGGGDALGDFGEEGVHQVGHDQPDHEGAAGGETARDPVGLVVELLDAGQHAAAGFGADIGASADHFGDRHHTDIEVLRNVLQAYGSSGSVRHGRFGGRAAPEVGLQAVRNASIPSCGGYQGSERGLTGAC